MSESLRDQIARAARDNLFPDYSDEPVGPAWSRWADAVLPLVEAEVERRTAALTAEREAARSNVAHWSAQWSTRLKATEARVTELERALREVLATANITWPPAFDDALDAARAVLAAAAPTVDTAPATDQPPIPQQTIGEPGGEA